MKLSLSILAALATVSLATASPFRLLTDAPAAAPAGAVAVPPVEIHTFMSSELSKPCPNHGRKGAWDTVLAHFGLGPQIAHLDKDSQDEWWRSNKRPKSVVGILPHPPSRGEAAHHGWIAIEMSQPGHPHIHPEGHRSGPHAHTHGHKHRYGKGHGRWHHHGKSFFQRLSRAAEQLSSTECFLIAYTIGAGTSITLGAVLLAIIAAFRGARARRQRAVHLPAYEAVPTVVDEKPSVA